MKWRKILNLALPTNPFFSLLAVSLGAVLGGGLHTLFQPSSDFSVTSPALKQNSNLKIQSWRQELLSSNGALIISTDRSQKTAADRK